MSEYDMRCSKCGQMRLCHAMSGTCYDCYDELKKKGEFEDFMERRRFDYPDINEPDLSPDQEDFMLEEGREKRGDNDI